MQGTQGEKWSLQTFLSTLELFTPRLTEYANRAYAQSHSVVSNEWLEKGQRRPQLAAQIHPFKYLIDSEAQCSQASPRTTN